VEPELVEAFNLAINGEFSLLLGDQTDNFHDFVGQKKFIADGILLQVDCTEFTAWMPFRIEKFTYETATIISEGILLPLEDADDPHEKPDEYFTWPSFYVSGEVFFS